MRYLLIIILLNVKIFCQDINRLNLLEIFSSLENNRTALIEKLKEIEFEKCEEKYLDSLLDSVGISVKTGLILLKKYDSENYTFILNELENKTEKLVILGSDLVCECSKDLSLNYMEIAFENYILNKTHFYYIDVFEHDEIKSSFKIDFIPSLLVLNKENKLIKKFEYEHNLKKIRIELEKLRGENGS